jgi:hypothetical protein
MYVSHSPTVSRRFLDLIPVGTSGDTYDRFSKFQKFISITALKMPEAEMNADVHLKPPESTPVWSLYISLKIVMGEIFIPVGRNIPSCRRRKWRIRLLFSN